MDREWWPDLQSMSLAAWKVTLASDQIKQLKYEYAFDATAGGSSLVFGDICN